MSYLDSENLATIPEFITDAPNHGPKSMHRHLVSQCEWSSAYVSTVGIMYNSCLPQCSSYNYIDAFWSTRLGRRCDPPLHRHQLLDAKGLCKPRDIYS